MSERTSLPGPEWCRTMWASPAAEMLWRPRIQAICEHWHAAERASVGAFRDACLTMATPEQLPELAAKATERRLTQLVLERVAAGDGYQAASAPAADGRWQYRVALVVPHRASEFHGAWVAGDQVATGEMLGFPRCCSQFFQREWVNEGWRDTTWPMVQPCDPEAEFIVAAAGPTESNILLRWIGVRWVPHLPCSFDCDDTADLGACFRGITPPTIADWMDELLETPVAWSARNGIAEIKTPLFTISAKTDLMPRHRCVRRHGRRYPTGGVRGLHFPYEPFPGAPAIDTWSDNGFVDELAMINAHAIVAAVANAGGQHDVAIDVGCGNGRLLEQIDARRRVGYEIEPERAAAARARGIDVVEGDVFEVLGFPAADLALLMPGRLVESGDRGRQLIKALKGSCRRLLVYAYGDWLRDGGLADLCWQAGLPGGLCAAVRRDGAEAGMWRWA